MPPEEITQIKVGQHRVGIIGLNKILFESADRYRACDRYIRNRQLWGDGYPGTGD
jgi:hypothetical protein